MRWVTRVVPAVIALAAGCSDSKGIIEAREDPAVVEVQVTPGAGELYVGGTLQLVAEPRDRAGRRVPGAFVYWKSSDNHIATVGRTGTVRGLAEGTVTITARSQDITGSALLEVSLDPSRLPAEVRIVPDSFTLAVGARTNLGALVLDSAGRRLIGAGVSWRSSDPAVATITAEGLVTGVAEGSITITAESHGVQGSAHITIGPNDAGAGIGPGTPFDAFGLRWTLTQPPGGALYYNLFYAAWGSSPSDVFAAGSTRLWDCCALIAHFDGEAWTEMQVPEVAVELSGIWGSAADDVFAVGWGHILHYDGTSWQEMPGGQGQSLSGIWGSSATDVWAVGGTLLHYDGQAWQQVPVPAGSGWLLDVWGTSASNVFAVSDGAFLHYDGSEWRRVGAPAGAGLRAVMGSSASDVFVIGAHAIYHYDGNGWSEMQSPTQQELLDLWVNGPDDVYVVASKAYFPTCCSALLHYDGSGWSAVETTTGHAPFGIWGTRDAMFIATSGGIIRGVR